MPRKWTRFNHHSEGVAAACSTLALSACFCLCSFVQPALAAVEWSGDIYPDDPTTWDSDTEGTIGMDSYGTLDIRDGGTITSHFGRIGFNSGSTGVVTVDGAGSTWTSDLIHVSFNGNATLNITHGGVVNSDISAIGSSLDSGVTAEVLVDGAGSMLIANNVLRLGQWGNGTLDITNGGIVRSGEGSIDTGSEVTVNGAGSTWTNNIDLEVGITDVGTLNITGGGLVSVSGTLTINHLDIGGLVNMSTGGMLALSGDADESLDDFSGLVDGYGTIRYWDDSISDWDDISDATYGDDYTLSYQTEGDLAGYTMLTVGVVPEPSTLAALMGLCLAGLLGSARRKRSGLC